VSEEAAFGPWLDTSWYYSDGSICQVRYPLNPTAPPTSMFCRGRGFDPVDVEELSFGPAGAEYRHGPKRMPKARTPNRHERRKAKLK